MLEQNLTVKKAYTTDTGRGIARMGPGLLEYLDIDPGDPVTIEGDRMTAATVWRTDQEDWDQSSIFLDSYLRANAGVDLGGTVTVRKAETRDAQRAVLAPMEEPNNQLTHSVVSALRQGLIQRPVREGDRVPVPISNLDWSIGSTDDIAVFVATAVEPDGITRIGPETQLEFVEEPHSVEGSADDGPSYETIGGLDDQLDRVREMIELPLDHPSVFEQLGIEPPKGVIFYGPPGTGKTFVAKAVASEVDAEFLSIAGPEIVSKYYGESEEALRETFEEATEKAPAIVFIDELDSIAPKRDETDGELEQRVVAQLLTLLDGLEERNEVVVIGATNQVDAVDPALRRPGRFDREVEFGVPDDGERAEILGIHTRDMPLDETVDVEQIADHAEGFVGADLEAVATEAAMHSLRRNLPEMDLDSDELPESFVDGLKVTRDDFEDVVDEVEPSALRELNAEVPEVHWQDVGGLDDAKQELRESIVWPVQSPEKFDRLGIEPPSGVLLYGPPGTGKTLLAKAVATESNTNFVPVNGPEVLSKWVGESEEAIRELFEQARETAPTVLFFDELESLAGSRSGAAAGEGTERVVNQLLTELDGLQTLEDVVVIGATNRPDILDPAVLRAGRFDRLVHVGPPDFDAREQILRVHTDGMPLAPDVSLRDVAAATDGYVGSDIEALAREAAIEALRERKSDPVVTMRHFEAAMDDISPTMTPALESHYERIRDEFERDGAMKDESHRSREFR
ncbi:CDC48 family AAA ATPase [Halomicrobium urmianum]|uniref:CDC48 family AAA ATPase n=1 Tax=Halomicrobium urmianum TaxID=1586233 RepID=UPI001CD93191|nr:CDC48 family AAA ATPase [Halomicrobium urmianum]